MQKISSIHPFILAIQQTLEPHDLKGASSTFDHAHPIIISYPDLYHHAKTQFIPLIPL